jgi:hypothetical protein
MNVIKMEPLPKWQEPPVHPAAANAMPMMSKAELRELARDIETYGLQEPVILWRDNREAANGATGPFPVYLLDGRNRLAALKLIKITDPTKAKPGNVVFTTVRTLEAVKQVSTLGGKTEWVTDCDPYAFCVSMNVYRRHLTAAQRRWAIKGRIIANPTASDREIARQTKTDHKTVAAARSEMSVPNGETPQTEHLHLPIERAKKALRANPALSARQLSAKAKVGASTAVKARKEMRDESVSSRGQTLAHETRASVDLRIRRQLAFPEMLRMVLFYLTEMPSAADMVKIMKRAPYMVLLTDEKLSKATQWLNEFQRAWTDARPGRRSS